MSVIAGYTPPGSTDVDYIVTVKGAPEILKDMVSWSVDASRLLHVVLTFSALHLHLTTSEMWCSGGRGILTELSLCYSIFHYNGAQWYLQFLQVGRLYRALILLGLALCLARAFMMPSSSRAFFGLHDAVCTNILVMFFILHFIELSLVGWSLTSSGMVLDLVD